MGNIKLTEMSVDGVYKIDYTNALDNRGEFVKLFEKKEFCENNISFTVSELYTIVSQKNVLRGLHFQRKMPQKRIFNLFYGKIFIVILDLRKKSSTYKEKVEIVLNSNLESVFVPRGCAVGTYAIEDSCIQCLCDGEYCREDEFVLKYDDPNFNINWPVKDNNKIIISDKDRLANSFNEYIRMNND